MKLTSVTSLLPLVVVAHWHTTFTQADHTRQTHTSTQTHTDPIHQQQQRRTWLCSL
jgi:DMSO reductase anchor subunit